MKKRYIFLCLLMLANFVIAGETIRTWKSQTGEPIIEAVWDPEDDPNPEKVYLHKDSKRLSIPLRNLSDDDQKFVREGRARKNARAEGGNFGLVEEPIVLIPSRKLAVLVGVTDYVEMNDLRYTVRDVEAIRDRLLKIGFKAEDIHLLVSGAGASEVPTKQNVTRTIDSVLETAQRGDLIFIAFAGHGAQLGEDAYFCTQDTLDGDIPGTSISIPEIMDKMHENPARFKWIVVDACRNNPFRNRVAGVRAIQKITNPPTGIVLFQSCAPNEFSYENEELQHGLFSFNFAQALEGAADDGD